ncbi:MAG: metallophosphoesterase [Victivallales bacterium]|nr:metallophosphoesterase [Victivallales bacterium]
MIFFISDTHFGHAAIIHLCKRPFESVEEMDETLVSNRNSRVGDGDTVYFLGDLFFRASAEHVREVLASLKGKKHLIIGNHDHTWMTPELLETHFLTVSHFLDISTGGHHFLMCHYPIMEWGGKHTTLMLHGHIHGNRNQDYWPLLQKRERVLNASVEINGYAPVTFEELVANNIRQKALPLETPTK